MEQAGAAGRLNWSRGAEFAALYLGPSLLLAFVLPPDWLWPVLFTATALGAVLLSRTPGFAWSELFAGWRRIDWREVGLIALVTAAVSAALVWWLAPGQALALPRRVPGLWLMILALYPLLSALPQELLFRALFFRRYRGLFATGRAALLANALVFALAHLMFWNWVALVLTFVGGLIFARAYLGRGGFPMAVVLHAICGGIIFTSGLGGFFYHGAIP